MKKGLCYILAIMMLMTAGCKSQKEKGQTEGTNFDIKVASNLVETYMKALTKEDYETISRMYTKDLAKEMKKGGTTDMKIRGYNVSETNEIGRSGLFKIKVTRSSESKSAASLDETTIRVVKDGAEYKISEIDSVYEKEAFLQGSPGQLGQMQGIRLRSKDNVKTNLIINLESIPQYAFEKNDKANIYKIPVPKNNFGTLSFSYNGERIAISTYEKDSFIGVVNIDESMATQGGASGGGEGGNGGGQGGAQGGAGGGQGGDQGGQGAREKPIGKETKALDLIRDSKIDFITFSLDEKYVLAQYTGAAKNKCIRVYKVDSGDLIPVKFEDSYPIDKVDVIFSSFDKEVLNYEVVPRGTLDKNQADVLGKYQLNFKDFKIKKI